MVRLVSSTAVTVGVGAIVAVGVVAVFTVDLGVTSPEPVSFDDTVRMGMADAEIRQAEFEGYETPRAQVFYSQYGFVVGFTGMESFSRALSDARYERIWGVPTHAYVTDFSGTEPSHVEGDFVDTDAPTDWVSAEDAVYAVGDETVLPFSSEDDAAAYTDEHGGEVVGFDGLLGTEFEPSDVYAAADEVVADRAAQADGVVENATRLLDRDISVTVGEDAETVQKAVEAASNGTAVRVPEGTYEEHVTVNSSVTLVGDGARLVGHGNGTVVTVTADDVAVSGMDISGVGDETAGEPGHDGDDWDADVETAYGGSDTAITFADVSGGLVHGVEIETPATGVMLHDTDVVVADTTVHGTDEWLDGFMGVLSIRSSGVVENSSFHGGRDSVYSHASDGLVVRDNYMEGARFGVHLMYTSDTLVRGNSIRDKDLSGVVIMTRPSGNYLVENDVRHSEDGLTTVGGESYFADNVLVNNSHGMRMGARNSVYTRNVIAHNDEGVRASSIIPSSLVSENDFVENGVQASSAEGSMRIWGHEGVGNYWSNAPEGTAEFRPTNPIYAGLTSVDGMVTVEASPAYSLLRGLETTIPGMQSSGIVDENPMDEPTAYGSETRNVTEAVRGQAR